MPDENIITVSPPTVDSVAAQAAAQSDIVPGSTATTLTPLTERAAEATALGRVRVRPFAERAMIDVPVDITTGIPLNERFALEFRREPDQKAYLERIYGVGNVRQFEGEWIVRKPNEATGILTDYKVEPEGPPSSLVAVPVIKQLAEYYLGAKAARALPKIGGAKGFPGALRDIAGGSTAIQVSGGVSDAVIRATEGRSMDFAEIARSRALLGALDLGIGGLGATGSAFMRFLSNPFIGSRAQVQIDGLAARDYLATKYGVDIELLPGEITGSPVLSRKELFMEKVPGSSAFFRAFAQKRDAAFETLQNIMLGRTVPDDDVLGNRAIGLLQRNIAPTEEAFAAAKRDLAGGAIDEISRIVSDATLAESNFTRAFIGDVIRNRVVSLRDEARASANALYAKVRALGGDAPIFNADELAGEARKMYADLPPQFRPTPAGVEVLPSTAFASETHVISKLRELMASEGQSFRLTDLQRMRREVFDDMMKGEAVPGLSTHYLSDIGNMITRAIERGVDALPTGELKAALQQANKFYRDEVLKFEQKGIAEIFNPISIKTHVGPAELASRLTTGPTGADKFNVLKGLLGENSLEIKLLKRQMADEVLSAGMNPGEKLINAKQLIASLDRFKVSNPDLYKDVFGKIGESIRKEAKLADVLDDDTLPVDVVRDLLRSPTPTATKLSAALTAQRELNATYRNTILNGIREGKFDATSIKPDEFVNQFMDKATRKEIKDVMDRLIGHPEIVEDIRASALQKMFKDSRLSGKTVTDALAKAQRTPELRELLGDEMFNDLEAFGFVQKAIAAKRAQAESAGAFAGSRRADEALTRPLRYVSDYVREMATAIAFSNPATRHWISRIPASEPSKLYLVLSSPPFVRAVMDHFGNDVAGLREARRFMASLKTGLDQQMSASFSERQKPPTTGTFALPPGQTAPTTNRAFFVSPPTLER